VSAAPTIPLTTVESSPGREVLQGNADILLIRPSDDAGVSLSPVAQTRLVTGDSRGAMGKGGSRAAASVRRRELSPGPPGLPGSRASMAMAPATQLTSQVPVQPHSPTGSGNTPAQYQLEAETHGSIGSDGRTTVAVQQQAPAASMLARPRSAPASARHMSAYERHVARMGEYRASQQVRQRTDTNTSPHRVSPRPTSPAPRAADRDCVWQDAQNQTGPRQGPGLQVPARSASAPRVPAQRSADGRYTASQGMASVGTSADVRAYHLLLRSNAKTQHSNSSPPSRYQQAGGLLPAVQPLAVSPTRRAGGGILGQWGTTRHPPGVRSSQVLGYAARAGFTPPSGTSSSATTDLTASITRVPGEHPGASHTVPSGPAGGDLTAVDALLQEADQAPDLDTAAAATVLAVEQLLSPREGPEPPTELAPVEHKSPAIGYTPPDMYPHPAQPAVSHSSTYLTAQVSPDPVWPAIAGRLGRSAHRTAPPAATAAAAAGIVPGRLARSPSPGFISRSSPLNYTSTAPGFTPSPGTRCLLSSKTVALPDFLTRQNAHLARKQAFVESQVRQLMQANESVMQGSAKRHHHTRL
jgi:hypothetical protein